MRHSIAPHLPLLIRFENQVHERPSGTKKSETGCAILGKIRYRRGLVNLALNYPGRAGQAAALVANGRQFDTRASGGVPDEILRRAIDGMLAIRGYENHAKRSCFD